MIIQEFIQPIYYDTLMFGCKEKYLGRVLPPTKFFSNKATKWLLNLLEHLSTQSNVYAIVYLASKMPLCCGCFKLLFPVNSQYIQWYCWYNIAIYNIIQYYNIIIQYYNNNIILILYITIWYNIIIYNIAYSFSDIQWYSSDIA